MRVMPITGVKEYYCPQNNAAGGGGGVKIIPVQSYRGAGMYRYYCFPGTKLPPHKSNIIIHVLFQNNIINWLHLGPINTLERLSLV